MVKFLPNPHNRQLIICPHGWDNPHRQNMGCFSKFKSVYCYTYQSVQENTSTMFQKCFCEFKLFDLCSASVTVMLYTKLCYIALPTPDSLIPWNMHTVLFWMCDHLLVDYRKVSNIRRTLVGNKIVDHSDVVGASPVGAAPNTSSFST